MTGSGETLTCVRCGTEFALTDDHSEFVRRDFVDAPRPSTVEHLCVDCWRAYVEEFLGRDFDDVLAAYDAPATVEE